MRLSVPLRAVTAAAAIALSTLASAPAHAGCVEDYLSAGYPGGGKTVTVNPDGSVTVNPNPTLNLAGAVVGNAEAFVDCVV
jgi:hypothetical protein